MQQPVKKTIRPFDRESSNPGPYRPWWKEAYVWLVISGPVSAVVACAVTAAYILQGPDKVVSEDYYREGIALGVQIKAATPPMQPAQTGRNHSATGGKTDGKR